MTTRGSLARGQGQQQFQGNVQKWVRQWVEPGNGSGSSKVALLKWVPTGDRSGSKPGPRFPHLHPVSSANLKPSAGIKDNGKKPIPRQHEPLIAQPGAMEVDGGQQVLASNLQQEGTQSAAVNTSRETETNGDAHTAAEQQPKQGSTELPSQEARAVTSQHAAGAPSDRHEFEAVPDVGLAMPDVAAEPSQTSNSHADSAPQRTPAPAANLASDQAAPAPQSNPETQQPAAGMQLQQDNPHGSTQGLQDASAAERGGNADGKLSLSASLGDEAPRQPVAGTDDEMLTGPGAPGQAPFGRDGEALTEQQAPDRAIAAKNRTLAGDEAPSGPADEALVGMGAPSGAADEAAANTAAETAASAAAMDSAVQSQQPAEGAPCEHQSLDEQLHNEPAAAAPTPAKRPAEGVVEGQEPDAKRAKSECGPDHPG